MTRRKKPALKAPITPSLAVRKASSSKEIGSTGLERSGGYIDEEFLVQLKGIRGVRAMREMSDNNAVVGASFNMMKWLMRSVDWKVVPVDGTPQAMEDARHYEQVLGDMSHTFSDYVTEAMSMLTFGFTPFEKVYKRRAAGRFGIRKLAIRAQETLDQREFDKNGGLRGMWQSTSTNFQRIFIPVEKMVLHRTESHKNNPEGRSLLRSAYRSWYFLKRLQELEAIGIEKDAVGMPVILLPEEYLDENASDEKKAAVESFRTLLEQLRRNSQEGILFPWEVDTDGNPTGFKLKLLESGGPRQIDPANAILRYEKRIAMVLQTGILFMGLDKLGSFALSSNMTNLLATALGAILDAFEETHHRFVTVELFELNGVPKERAPRLKHGDIERRNLKEVADALGKLAENGFITPDDPTEASLRAEAGLPPRHEESARAMPEHTIEDQNRADEALNQATVTD